ncbi:hypothetical protein CerSpe_171740 [Prunus speciosa]
MLNHYDSQCESFFHSTILKPRHIDGCLSRRLCDFIYQFEAFPFPPKVRVLTTPHTSCSDYSNQSRSGLPHFFSELIPISKGGIVRVQGDEFWHMTKVLRLRTNDRVELFNGKGGLIQGLIQSVDRSGLHFVALKDPKSVLPQSTQWHVFAAFGTLKGGRADWLVEKCTELGASSLTPLLTEWSPTVSENRVERLQLVNMAAAKQCQWLHEMILNPPKNINGLLPLVA